MSPYKKCTYVVPYSSHIEASFAIVYLTIGYMKTILLYRTHIAVGIFNEVKHSTPTNVFKC